MGIELPELGVEVLAVIVSLADAGLAVCDCNHRHPVQKTGVFERGITSPLGQLAEGVQQLCAIIVGAQQVRQEVVEQGSQDAR